jgi:hypothetical protein
MACDRPGRSCRFGIRTWRARINPPAGARAGRHPGGGVEFRPGHPGHSQVSDQASRSPLRFGLQSSACGNSRATKPNDLIRSAVASRADSSSLAFSPCDLPCHQQIQAAPTPHPVSARQRNTTFRSVHIRHSCQNVKVKQSPGKGRGGYLISEAELPGVPQRLRCGTTPGRPKVEIKAVLPRRKNRLRWAARCKQRGAAVTIVREEALCAAAWKRDGVRGSGMAGDKCRTSRGDDRMTYKRRGVELHRDCRSRIQPRAASYRRDACSDQQNRRGDGDNPRHGAPIEWESFFHDSSLS